MQPIPCRATRPSCLLCLCDWVSPYAVLASLGLILQIRLTTNSEISLPLPPECLRHVLADLMQASSPAQGTVLHTFRVGHSTSINLIKIISDYLLSDTRSHQIDSIHHHILSPVNSMALCFSACFSSDILQEGPFLPMAMANTPCQAIPLPNTGDGFSPTEVLNTFSRAPQLPSHPRVPIFHVLPTKRPQDQIVVGG